jgi:hypothetical protein
VESFPDTLEPDEPKGETAEGGNQSTISPGPRGNRVTRADIPIVPGNRDFLLSRTNVLLE